MSLGTKRSSILVIDDEETLRDACRQTLERNPDYGVECADDGPAGIARVRRGVFDLVIVDLKLPGMGGIEIIREILRFDPTIVTLIITGYPTVASAVDAMKNGAYDFLPKPFTPDELRIIVRRALEKRHLESERRALLAERESLQRNFVSLVSHELRAPLICVEQYVDAILTGAVGKIVPEQEDILRRISIRMEGLLGLIDTWLNLNRMKTGKYDAGMKEFGVLPMLREAVETLQPAAQARGVRVSVDGPEGLNITADPECLKILFMNLIGNAVKYNRENGSVSIRAAALEEGGASIEVRDTGRGIPAEDLPLIFDEFYRGRDGGKDKPAGSGLGLALVRQIVQLHDGRIDVNSELGKGTSFSVTLPSRRK
ncbi:MAG TPA: hypothetical protein DCM05_15325 [Elusimicrobia bacterium]|nr:hypothetical protein [Elusimicrobiota bacterium]